MLTPGVDEGVTSFVIVNGDEDVANVTDDTVLCPVVGAVEGHELKGGRSSDVSVGMDIGAALTLAVGSLSCRRSDNSTSNVGVLVDTVGAEE